jgi:hypothetical protein
MWPWVILMFNLISSFAMFVGLSTSQEAAAAATATAAAAPPLLLLHISTTPSMTLFLELSHYIVLFTGIVHMVTYYTLRPPIASAGFVAWLMFMIFVAALPPFVYALSTTADAILLILSYSVLVISTVPAMTMRSHQWRMSNATTSILFACSSLAMRRTTDVRVVLITTLFAHYLSMSTVCIAQHHQDTASNDE